MAHNFKLFPELTNNQMQIYYWESPHKQILEDFEGKVVKITDGDTIHVKWSEREKPIVVRLANIDAAEMNERGGIESRNWLEKQIMDEYVRVELHPSRVEKWGRILGEIIHLGININKSSMDWGFSVPFEGRELR